LVVKRATEVRARRQGRAGQDRAGQDRSCDASPKRAMKSSAVLGAIAVAAIAAAMLRYALPPDRNENAADDEKDGDREQREGEGNAERVPVALVIPQLWLFLQAAAAARRIVLW
jgi:hypothetical protein